MVMRQIGLVLAGVLADLDTDAGGCDMRAGPDGEATERQGNDRPPIAGEVPRIEIEKPRTRSGDGWTVRKPRPALELVITRDGVAKPSGLATPATPFRLVIVAGLDHASSLLRTGA
jgi:hypothetical protein